MTERAPGLAHDVWDRELEFGLPDCRVHGNREKQNTLVLGRLIVERVFCANCGKAGPGIWGAIEFVFYVCDECDQKPEVRRFTADCLQLPDDRSRS